MTLVLQVAAGVVLGVLTLVVGKLLITEVSIFGEIEFEARRGCLYWLSLTILVLLGVWVAILELWAEVEVFTDANPILVPARTAGAVFLWRNSRFRWRELEVYNAALRHERRRSSQLGREPGPDEPTEYVIDKSWAVVQNVSAFVTVILFWYAVLTGLDDNHPVYRIAVITMLLTILGITMDSGTREKAEKVKPSSPKEETP